jgi:hypothetical protein
MSAQFILEYAGSPVLLSSVGARLVTEAEANKYISEQDAWYAAYQAGLNPDHCRVVNLCHRNLKTGGAR